MNEAIHLQDNLLLLLEHKKENPTSYLHICLKTSIDFWFLLHTLALCGSDGVARET